MYRATHQVLNDGRIFADPSRYLGLNVDLITRGQDHRYGRNMRDCISAKTRFAENLDTRKRKRIAVRVAAPFLATPDPSSKGFSRHFSDCILFVGNGHETHGHEEGEQRYHNPATPLGVVDRPHGPYLLQAQPELRRKPSKNSSTRAKVAHVVHQRSILCSFQLSAGTAACYRTLKINLCLLR
jgi:hypothetical protein